MIKPRLDIPLYTVVEDSPSALVLANKGPRYLAVAGLILLAALFLSGTFGLDKRVYLGASDVTLLARAFFASVLVVGFFRALDSKRISFDSGTRSVTFASRLRPWASLTRPAADIQRVEVTSRTTKVTSSDSGDHESVVHYLHLVFQDGERREVNRSTDPEFIRALASRVEAFRR